jgi:uncharacterized protein involved in response to NO
MTTNPRSGTYAGMPLFSYGFRPFFLLGACYAALAVLVWLPIFTGTLPLATTLQPRDWHVHEMLYGYLPAVVTGFVFTAIPNWTGRLPTKGAPLMILAGLWMAGRLCVTFSQETGWIVAMLIDAGFLLSITFAAAREIIAGRKWGNLGVVALIALLCAGNIGFHLEAHFSATAAFSIRAGIGAIVLMISLIGGRIIPSFTRNWLAKQAPGRLPAPFSRFDMFAVGIATVALMMWTVIPEGAATGTVLAVAGVVHFARLMRWTGDRTGREPLLLILHVAYGFIPLGFLLAATQAFGGLSGSAGVHAWMVGGAGTMTLAVMTRATLGHTGQTLAASAPTRGIYLAILIAATARILAAVDPTRMTWFLGVAAISWAAAFFGFAAIYGPALVGHDKRSSKKAAVAS